MPDPAWDVWLESRGVESDFLQTTLWAQIDEAANGVRSCVLETDDGVAGLVGRPPGIAAELRCLHGPVFADPGRPEGVGEFARTAEELARRWRCGSIRFVGRPPLSDVEAGRLAAQLTSLGYRATPWLTSVVDLARSDDELLASADRAVGKAIRRCMREGISIRRCEDAESYERLFLESFAATRTDYRLERGRHVFELDRGRHYRFYVAIGPEEDVHATLGTYRFGGVATEIMSSRTTAGRRHGAPAQDLLHWHVLRDHRDLGDAWFDLAGYAAAPATPAEAGIRRFKEKWGGREVESPFFEKDLHGRFGRIAARVRARRG